MLKTTTKKTKTQKKLLRKIIYKKINSQYRLLALFAVRPLSVRFKWKPLTLTAGEEHVLTCESTGSRPQAVLTWWIEDRKFTKAEVSFVILLSNSRKIVFFIFIDNNFNNIFKNLSVFYSLDLLKCNYKKK